MTSTTSSHRAEIARKKVFKNWLCPVTGSRPQILSHCTCDTEIGQRIEPKTCKSSYQLGNWTENRTQTCKSSYQLGNWTENRTPNPVIHPETREIGQRTLSGCLFQRIASCQGHYSTLKYLYTNPQLEDITPNYSLRWDRLS